MLAGLYVSFYASVCLHIYQSFKAHGTLTVNPVPVDKQKHTLLYIYIHTQTQPQQRLVLYRSASLDHSERSMCSLDQWMWKG